MVDKKMLATINNEVWHAYMGVVDSSDKDSESYEEKVGVLLDRLAQATMTLLDKEIERA